MPKFTLLVSSFFLIPFLVFESRSKREGQPGADSTLPTSSKTTFKMTASTCTGSSSHADRLGFSTKAIHVGSEPEHSASNGVSPAIDLSTTYSQGTIGATKFEYSRSSNPTRLALERQLAALEGADVLLRENLAKEGLEEDTPAALALSSGSTATATVVQSLAGNGGHIVSVGDVYGGTSRFMTKVAANLSNVTTSFVDMSY